MRQNVTYVEVPSPKINGLWHGPTTSAPFLAPSKPKPTALTEIIPSRPARSPERARRVRSLMRNTGKSQTHAYAIDRLARCPHPDLIALVMSGCASISAADAALRKPQIEQNARIAQFRA